MVGIVYDRFLISSTVILVCLRSAQDRCRECSQWFRNSSASRGIVVVDRIVTGVEIRVHHYEPASKAGVDAVVQKRHGTG